MKVEELEKRCVRFIEAAKRLGFLEIGSSYDEEVFGNSSLLLRNTRGLDILIYTDRGDEVNIDILSETQKSWTPMWWILSRIGVDDRKLTSADRHEVYIDNVISEFIDNTDKVLEFAMSGPPDDYSEKNYRDT